MSHIATYSSVHHVSRWEFEAVEIRPDHRSLSITGYDEKGYRVYNTVLYSTSDETWEQFQKVAQSVEVVS